MTPTELNQRFSIPGHVSFKEIAPGLAMAEIANAHAAASVVLQGAHLTTWQPRGQAPVIWLSPLAKFLPGKSIRGGVPVCWPWFGPHAGDAKLPGHGFARTVMWEVLETRALPDGATFLRFGLVGSEVTRTQWPHPSGAQLEITVGATLKVELATRNSGAEAFALGEALHTHFHVSDLANVRITGLEGCEYLDKVGAPARRRQDGAVAIASEVDRIYLDVPGDCLIEDGGLRRRIRIAGTGARSAVVWNPWIEKAEKMGDFGPDGYRGMVCVETANAADNVVTVAPGTEHRMAAVYSVELLG